jgi:hypothetical protein
MKLFRDVNIKSGRYVFTWVESLGEQTNLKLKNEPGLVFVHAFSPHDSCYYIWQDLLSTGRPKKLAAGSLVATLL